MDSHSFVDKEGNLHVETLGGDSLMVPSVYRQPEQPVNEPVVEEYAKPQRRYSECDVAVMMGGTIIDGLYPRTETEDS